MDNKSIRKIDRYSPMPVYQQIANDIIARISQEEWSVGDKLPSENELAEEYDASRVTIRQALEKLEMDGLIDKQRGRGAFLKNNPMRVVHELFLPQPGVQHKAINKSEKVTIKVVTQANPKVYSNLGLKPGTPLAYLERLFTRKKRVVGINCAWFPLSLVPDIVNDGLLENSISRTLQEKYHLNFDSVENYIEAIMLDAQTAQQFDIVSPSPALRITSVYTLSSGKPVEYSVTIWNGRDTQFHVMISSQ